jgi:hypothetical protein
VPVLSTPRIEAIAHAIGRLRPSLFAYQFVVAATVDHAAIAEPAVPHAGAAAAG